MIRSRRAASPFLAFLLAASAGFAGSGLGRCRAQPAPLSPELRVDAASDVGPANNPKLALQGDGSFEIAWDSGEVGSARILARHFAPDGTPTSAEPQVAGVGGGEFNPLRLIAAAGRGFEVVWQEISDLRPERSPFLGRHLNRQGVPDEGPPTRLGSAETHWIWHVPALGLLSGRSAPRAHGFAAQRLGPKGRPTGPEIRINSRPVDEPEPFLFGLPGGGLVAVWGGMAPGAGEPPLRLLRARRFDAAAAPLGPEFDLNSLPVSSDEGHFLTADFSASAAPDGGFAVAWAVVDGDRSTLYLRSFDRAGHATGPEIAVVEGEGSLTPAALAIDRAGNVLLLSLHLPAESPAGDLRMQLFSRRGSALGPAQELNSEASGEFAQPFTASAAWTGDSWLVTWAAEVEEEGRGAVFVRRFAG